MTFKTYFWQQSASCGITTSQLDKDGGSGGGGRCGGAAVGQTVSQQQLLLSGATGPADVLAVGVVEPQEGQDGVGQPQSRHSPQRRLRRGVINKAYSHAHMKKRSRPRTLVCVESCKKWV